ncbi:hypothetical protein ACT6QG_11965 [Xanthobacter sp. TB0136]|uniref:hypothetical protein n=1 Tax=Xanthobacter sp. TB0136 TaxID=3459177 RepID=UPI0040391AF2
MNAKLAWTNARTARSSRPVLTGGAVAVMALTLAACSTGVMEPPAPALPQYSSPIPPDQFIGRWGLASYHRPDDATRTERQARGQCSNPYVITGGNHGGVLMYLADDNKLTEVVSKAAGGPTYLGPPEDPAGGPRDRQILRKDNDVMVLKWVDPEVAGRYGTMIYVRCP